MNRQQACSILELPLNPADSELKKAYRRKAMLFHPDRNKSSDAAQKFIEVNKAYDFLSHNTYRPEPIRRPENTFRQREEELRRRNAAYASNKKAKEERERQAYRTSEYRLFFKIVFDGWYVLMLIVAFVFAFLPIVMGFMFSPVESLYFLPAWFISYLTFKEAMSWKRDTDMIFEGE